MRLGTRIAAIAILAMLALTAAARPAAAQNYRRWYLAEGAANTFFNETILIGNPNATVANITIRLLPEGAAPVTIPPFQIGGTSRYTFNVNGVTGLPQGAVSAIVDSDVDIVVERSMTWPGPSQRGGHNSGGVLAPAGQWYLAEGVTGFFETFVLITNTSTAAQTVDVTFLRENSGPLVRTYELGPSGRKTVYVNGEVRDDQGQPINEPFSTVVRQRGGGADLVVERAMYWNSFEGGHGAAAVTAPSPTWVFAEGVCGGSPSFSFQTYLLLANPGTVDATATLTFFRDAGGPVTKQVPVPAGRRVTLFLNELPFANNVAELANASFSTRITSTQPILAERAVYWSSAGITFIEGNDAAGVTAEATKWAFAEGIEGVVQHDGPSHDSYFLISNANPTPITIRSTFVREDGRGIVDTRVVPAQSRATILTSAFAALSHQRFAAFIESVDATPLPFVAERATYWGTGYYGGHGSAGVPWTGTIATPGVVDLTPQVTSLLPNHGPATGGTDVTIQGANFTESTTVTIGGRPAAVTPVDYNTLIVRAPAAPGPGPADVTVTNAGFLPVTRTSGYTYDPVGPFLMADTILAFGDSITAGVTRTFCGMVLCDASTTPYPQRLESILRARFPAQSAIVQGSGSAGECVSANGCTGTAGRDRLPTVMAPSHDLVVLLEGVNDTNAGPTDGAIVNALRSMIQTARNAGKSVILCGLLPVKPREDNGMLGASPARIASVNTRLAQLASDEGVPFVNMVAAFGPAFQPLLSPDGLHPNGAGYQRMAEAVSNAIVAFYAIP